MEILINSDNEVKMDQEGKDYFRAELQDSLKRFEDYVTRFEVYFSDETSNKDTPGDQKCVIEARIKGRNSEIVTSHASAQKAAFDASIDKIRTVLDRVIEQQRGH